MTLLVADMTTQSRAVCDVVTDMGLMICIVALVYVLHITRIENEVANVVGIVPLGS